MTYNVWGFQLGLQNLHFQKDVGDDDGDDDDDDDVLGFGKWELGVEGLKT